MTIEVVVINKDNGGFSLWINDDQPFHVHRFKTLMEELKIERIERVRESFGPAEIVDNIHTAHGVFGLHMEFDEFAGTTIYSEDGELMEKILELMIQSGDYRRKKSSRPIR